ncbi:MAG: hypothetical protein WC295_06395 [Methanoregula sp.]|jgi:hypothetical protein
MNKFCYGKMKFVLSADWRTGRYGGAGGFDKMGSVRRLFFTAPEFCDPTLERRFADSQRELSHRFKIIISAEARNQDNGILFMTPVKNW